MKHFLISWCIATAQDFPAIHGFHSAFAHGWVRLLMRCPKVAGLRSRHENAGDRFMFAPTFVSCIAPIIAVGQLCNVHDRRLLAEPRGRSHGGGLVTIACFEE